MTYERTRYQLWSFIFLLISLSCSVHANSMTSHDMDPNFLDTNPFKSTSLMNLLDAPKYYERNAQLYKNTESLRPSEVGRSENSIDKLINSMKNMKGSERDLESLAPDNNDDSIVQRKSTDEKGGLARLRKDNTSGKQSFFSIL